MYAVQDVDESPLLDAPMPRVEIPLPPQFAEPEADAAPPEPSEDGSSGTGTEGE
jgi:hypothetical protein